MENKGFDRIEPFFHENVVVIPPGFRHRAAGREVCLNSYKDACSQMTFHKLQASDEQIDIFGSFAVATNRFDCIWEFQGKKFEEDGREILVLEKDSENWKIAWRTLIPSARHVDAVEGEEPKEGANGAIDLRQRCIDLMAARPVCFLTTMDEDGFPNTNAMNNLRHTLLYPSLKELFQESQNEFTLYLSTSMQSYKVARMQANPRISVYFCDEDQFFGFNLRGEVELVLDQDLKDRIWQKGWTIYYPNGPEGWEFGVIKLKPKTARGWSESGTFELKL